MISRLAKIFIMVLILLGFFLFTKLFSVKYINFLDKSKLATRLAQFKRFKLTPLGKIIALVLCLAGCLYLSAEGVRIFWPELHLYGNSQAAFFNDLVSKWDASHYLEISRNAYYERNIAFFPLYPFVIFIVNLVIGNRIISGLLISIVSLIVGLYFLYKLILLDDDEKTAWLTIKYMLIYPFSFFYLLIYTESLFLCLSVLTMYVLRKKKWRWAGVLGLFSVLTRSFGIILIFPALIESDFLINFFKLIKNISWQKIISFSKQYVWLISFPTGLLFYLLINKIYLHDWFMFMYFQSYEWGHKFVFIHKALEEQIGNVLIKETKERISIWWPQMVITIGVVCSLFYGLIRKVRPSYLVYAFFYLIFTISISFQVSLGRFFAVLFPFFYILAKYAKKHPSTDLMMSLILPVSLTFYWLLFVFKNVIF